MKREISVAPSFFDARSVDIEWLDRVEPERLDSSKADVFETVVWSLVWMLAIVIVLTAVLGGAAIVQSLNQPGFAPTHQNSFRP